MPHRDADRNLLFGITALQNDFITRDALIAAMNAWALEKHRPIGEILVERGALDPADRAALEAMIARRLAKHDNDPTASLAAISSVEEIAAEIRRSVADPEVHESIAHVSEVDPHATRATQTADYFPKAVRYQKVREHAKGGLGVVFVARDNELNREVALKEIKSTYANNIGMQSRFLIEAEITGGLEHPGIVPVYGLGHDDAGQPFYAMRFIRGDSLKEAIAAFHADKDLKSDPGARILALQKLLRRFLDVCNAIDYAHSRGVLHRDLKPANVMVGRYGETLVVDWGLAKSIGRSGADGLGSMSVSPLFPSTSGSADTTPGSQVGSPAYMSPEAAAGRLDLLGTASDVYGLGATLYSLLTNQPPITDSDRNEVYRKVERGDFPPPRQICPWLDPALNAICLKAMALKPGSRYPSPRALADDIDRWIAGEPVLAYPEPWSRRTARWAKKHRTGLATTASAVAVAVVLLGAVAGWRIAEQRKAEASARAYIAKADAWAIRAQTSGHLADWDHAIAEAKLAHDRLESGGGAALQREVDAHLASFQAEQARRGEALEADRKDQKVVVDLDEARLLAAQIKEGKFDIKAKLDAYLAAFRSYGIEIATLPVPEAAEQIRRSRVADALIAALDDWSRPGIGREPRERLSGIARAAESDPIRLSIREAIERRDIAALRRFCQTQEARRKLGPRIRRVFDALLELDPGPSFPLLESILVENPADFWMNHDFGYAFSEPKSVRANEALRRLTAAVALRPESAGAHLNLGFALSRQGQVDPAIAEYHEAIRIKPDIAEAHSNLSEALRGQGQLDAAIAESRIALRIKPDFAEAHYNLANALRDQGQFEAALAEYRQAIRIKPEYADAHNNLGTALNDHGQLDAAIVEYREALRIKPNHDQAHNSLGTALFEQGQLDAAIVEYREALRIKPDHVEAHNNLGTALSNQGQVDAAIAEHREAIRINPNYSAAHYNLGNALGRQRQVDAAIAEYREAIRIKPEYAESHYNLGLALSRQGKAEAAIAEYREAIRIKPRYAEAHTNLANALSRQGQFDTAIVEYHEALRIKPDFAEAYCNLGLVLQGRGRFVEALENLEKGHAFGSKRRDWRLDSETWVREARRLVDLEAKLTAIIKGEVVAGNADDRVALATLCSLKRMHATAARFWAEAFAERPALAEDVALSHRYNAACSASLAGSGQGKDEPPLDDSGRAKLRNQALAWLKADLAVHSKPLGDGKPADLDRIAKMLAHWQVDTDLAGIRDEASLAILPEEERVALQALWAEAARLLARAGER